MPRLVLWGVLDSTRKGLSRHNGGATLDQTQALARKAGAHQFSMEAAHLMGTLYLVDDHAMVRNVFRTVLTASGHVVLGESDNPTIALADIQRLNPQVVVLDLNLGVRSGLELLNEIQKRHLPARVVVLTMANHANHVAAAIKLGALAYVLKGAALTELLQAIDKALHGQHHFDGEVADLVAQALAQPAEVGVNTLSVRERQVVVMVVRGHSSTEIGEALHLSPKTVDTYRSRLMSKLGVSDVPALVRLAIRSGLIDVDEH